MPFNNDQALELIDRLEYCPEEPKLEQQFRERLVSDYFKSHAEFVTNPLLLGQNYHFLHRSFQEYFFVDYYSRQDDTTLMKLGSYIDTADQIFFDEGSTFDMLYDFAQDKVERFIIMSFLASIYNNEGDKDKYWLFLTKGYDLWIYQIYREDLIEDARAKYNIHECRGMICYENSQSSVILSLVLKVIGADLQFKTEKSRTDLMYDNLICERLYGELLKGGGGSENTVIMPLMRVPEEISKHLGVSKDTIRGWIKKETIPYYKVGRQYKFKVSEVDAWIHSGESADADK